MALPFGIIAGDLPQAMIIASGIQMVYLGLSALIYYPFFKVYDKQELQKELEGE